MFIHLKERFVKSCLLLLVCLMAVSCSDDQGAVLEEITSNPFHAEFLSQVNRLRAEGCTCGRIYFPPAPALKWNHLLEQAARRHSEDMSRNNHFDHVGTDGSTFTRRIEEAGYRFEAAGENIAYGYISIVSVMTGWKNSPGHCKVMMDPNLTEMGAAKVNEYWTQVLAKPLRQ